MTKEKLIQLADDALGPPAMDMFVESLDNDKISRLRALAEDNLDLAKKALHDNAMNDYCDSAIVNYYKQANYLYSGVMEYFEQELEKDMKDAKGS